MRIGIDLGGTKIEGIALDSSGTECARKRIPTPTGDYTETLNAVCNLVETLEKQTGEQGTVGIGIPGTISPKTGLIKNANSTCLIGQPMDHDLQNRLKRPVRLANDANCFTVSEATDGAGQSYDMVFGVILGTGIGGGLTIKGTVHTGMNAIGGEWGHNPLPWPVGSELPGPTCYCGKTGCIETFLSGPGLEHDFNQLSNVTATAEEIVKMADAGDPFAEQALTQYQDRLARSLASIINILDPDLIVLGGGLSNLDRIYTNVPRLWQDWVFSDHADTPLVKNQHGDSSGVRGAAWLWPPEVI